jgi:predicted nucleotidyltransferase component of viral defense system
VVPAREILDLRTEWSLDAGVIEKDYVLGWLLAGIANHARLSQTWVFKGGTCLRKCYYETYRFSEDLDFTVVDGPETPEELAPIFREIGGWMQEVAGIDLLVEETSFRRRKNRRGNPTTQGRIAYRGPNRPPQHPKVKVDITSDEVLVERAVLRAIGHQYSDAPLPGNGVICYSLVELFGEKLRALSERCRPRDLYDVVHMHRHPRPKLPAAQIRDLATLRWLHAGEHVILHGPVGVGKSHIAQALGHMAIRQGAEVRSPQPAGFWPPWPAATPTTPGHGVWPSWPAPPADPGRLRHARAHRRPGRRPVRAGRRTHPRPPLAAAGSNRAPVDWYGLFPNPVIAESLLDGSFTRRSLRPRVPAVAA